MEKDDCRCDSRSFLSDLESKFQIVNKHHTYESLTLIGRRGIGWESYHSQSKRMQGKAGDGISFISRTAGHHEMRKAVRKVSYVGSG